MRSCERRSRGSGIRLEIEFGGLEKILRIDLWNRAPGAIPSVARLKFADGRSKRSATTGRTPPIKRHCEGEVRI